MSLLDNEPTGNTAGIDADALLNEIESGSSLRDAPVEGQSPKIDPAPEQVATEGAPSPGPQVPQHTGDEFEFTWNGKQIKANRERALQWASQGYDYAQKMAEYRKQEALLEQQRQQHTSEYEQYKLINQYAKENPDWWKHIESQYQATVNGAQTQSSQVSLPPEVAKEINDLKNWKSQLDEERAQKQRESEDQALQSEMKSIRDQFANLDFDTPDETGYSLTQKVLKHAVDNGINSFRAAFRDYNHDHLLKLASDRAKEDAMKNVQKRNQLGILGTSQTSKKVSTPVQNVKTKSYNDIEAEIRQEYGIG